MKPVTLERLAEIEERCDKATPGPWGISDDCGCKDILTLDGEDGYPYQIGYTHGMADEVEDCANGTFVVHARTDLPDLAVSYREAVRLLERDHLAPLQEANPDCDVCKFLRAVKGGSDA